MAVGASRMPRPPSSVSADQKRAGEMCTAPPRSTASRQGSVMHSMLLGQSQ
jgi:hypothetical protein